MAGTVVSVAAVVGAPCARAGDATEPGKLLVDPPTLRCIGFRWYISGDDNGNATCAMSYRKAGSSAWARTLGLLRINRHFVDKLLCNIFAR